MSKKRRDSYFNQSEENYEESYGYDDDDLLPEQQDNRWELEESEIIDRFKRDFKGILTEKGLADISVWLRVALNRHLALSNLSESRINKISYNLCSTLSEMIILEHASWNLTDDSRRSQIHNFVKELIEVHLRRAYNDGERIYRSNTYRGVGGFEENNKKSSSSLYGLFGKKTKEKRETNIAQRDYHDESLDEEEVRI